MNNNYNKKIFCFFLFFCFFLIKADFVLALEQQYPPIFGLSIGNGTLPEYARYFFNIGMAIAGTLAVIVIVFGGIYYLVSLGMGKFTDEGKQWIKAGVLGLILTVSSYLIAYTINPNLVVFNLNELLPIPFNSFFSQPPPNTIPFIYYDEIPIGTLTENVLSRTMNCYEFDDNGDPIEGKITTDDNQVINGPALLNHDRVDCFLKLTEATEKKSKLIKKLSNEIIKLMESCTCEGKCDNKCDITAENACDPPVGEECLTGRCKDKACKPFTGKSNDCCPPGVKDKIEHGPIKLPGDKSNKEYKGLDEFRTKLTNISIIVENPPVQVGEKPLITINNGSCATCDTPCRACDIKDTDCLDQQKKCQDDNLKCLNNTSRINCLKQGKWYKLKLIEQLMYLKEKMNPIKTSVEQDRDQLKSAENTLGQCYLAEPYIDFLKTVEKTKKENKIILAQKNFNDPETQKQIDVYKYCKGFDYANSNAYSKCQNICPETLKDTTCYKNCQKCNEKDPKKQAICLENQTKCMKVCYDKHECPANANPPINPSLGTPFSPATFKECIQGLNQSCSDICARKYPNSQEDFQKCQENCGKDSKCLLDNAEKCTVNFPQLKACSDNNYKDPDNLQNCINNSFLCKYGSDEYAGYPDCVKGQGQYSSSFLYKNPDNQKCKNPYESYTNGVNIGQTCLNLYPETAKCPLSSLCPKCPCGIINETVDESGSECPLNPCTIDGSNWGEYRGVCSCYGRADGCLICDYSGSSGSSSENGSGGSSGGLSTKILEYQVVTGTCNESSYNDDSLTFYCQQNWWNKENKVEEKNPTPIGKDRICSKVNEIPVGQTVDDTEKWADEFIKNINDFTETTEEMIQYIKKIVEEKNYCQCDSVCENGLPCSSDCEYIPIDDYGVPAYCAVKSCAGISCQKVINLLRGGSTENCPVKKDGIFYYYDKVYKGFKTFYKFAIIDSRTDILKELSYSRKKMNESSTAQSAFDKEVKTLSCERVQDEIISPIKEGEIRVDSKTTKSYCYGKILGKILKTPEPMADNWFVCEERQGINE